MLDFSISGEEHRVLEQIMKTGCDEQASMVKILDAGMEAIAGDRGTVTAENYFTLNQLAGVIIRLELLEHGALDAHRIKTLEVDASVKDWIKNRRRAIGEDNPSFIIVGNTASDLLDLFRRIFSQRRFAD